MRLFCSSVNSTIPSNVDRGVFNHPMSDEQSQLSKRAAADLISAMATGMEEVCMSRCLPKPGLRMDSKQDRCIRQCMERFVEAWTITSSTINNVSIKSQSMD